MRNHSRRQSPTRWLEAAAPERCSEWNWIMVRSSQGGEVGAGEVAIVEDDFWIDHYRRPIGCKYSLLIGLKQTGQGDSNLELGQ
jgi:hypothetical protein